MVKDRNTEIFSIGHGAKPIQKLLEELKDAHVQRVVDARSFPRSRFHPQYNQKALGSSLSQAGIAYEWRGDSIGGRGENVGYAEVIRELAERAVQERIALLCSESDYRACHRHTKLKPSLQEANVDVVHLPRAQEKLL